MFLRRFMFLLISASVVFASCQKKAVDDGKLKIGLVTDVGGVHDQSFNESSWEGLSRFGSENGATVRYIETRNESDYASGISNFTDEGYDFIWGVGFMMSDAILNAGRHYPEQQFAIIDVSYDNPADIPNNNVTGVVFANAECSFLVGYIAGKMTKTGKVAHISGIATPVMEGFAVGYYAGVLTANPNAVVVGQYAGNYDDPAGGKAIANQFYADGADIIFSAAGATGSGAIEAAKELKKWAIGVDRDQNYIAPNNVLTSAIKRCDVAVEDVCKQLADGTFEGGGNLVYDLANGGVGYSTTGNHIPKEIISEVEAIKAKIISRDQKVPVNAAEFNAMFPGKYNMQVVGN